MSPATTTIRVRVTTRDRLARLADRAGISGVELLDRMVEREEEARMLDAMNADFAQLRKQPEAWSEFAAEVGAWDRTSGDPGFSGK